MKMLKIVVIAVTLMMATAAFAAPVLAQDSEPPDPPVVEITDGAPFGGIVELLTTADMKRAGILMFLILGNWLTASLVALAQGQFNIKKFPEFFYKTFIPFFGGFVILQAAWHVLSPATMIEAFGKEVGEQFATVFDAGLLWSVFGAMLISVGRSFVANFAALIGVIVGGAQKLAAAATPKA